MASSIDENATLGVFPTVSVGKSAMDAIRRDYERDGAAVIRNIIPLEWLDRLVTGTERLLRSAGDEADMNRPGEGRFFGDLFAYLRTPEYLDFIEHSGIGKMVAEIMDSATIRFFYDQPLVKEPGTPKATPWHQDSAYWPCTGRKIMSVWVPLDQASSDNGVVRYVKGSHRWSAFYPIEAWNDKEKEVYDSKLGDKSLTEDPGPGATRHQPRTIADIREHPENYDLTDWAVMPGDVLVHQIDTIHGAPGNGTQSSRRRAIAFRFFGDDARWDDSRPHFLRLMKRVNPSFPYPNQKTGELISDPLFPVIWARESI